MHWSKDNFEINGSLLPRGYYAGLVARYPDIYDGTSTSRGNPWILSNMVFAEAMVLIGNAFSATTSVKLSPQTTDILQEMWAITKSKKSQCTQNLLDNLLNAIYQGKTIEDATTAQCVGFGAYYYSLHTVNVVHEQIGLPTDMSEQIHRVSGRQVGASFLTWSYSTYLSWYKAFTAANP